MTALNPKGVNIRLGSYCVAKTKLLSVRVLKTWEPHTVHFVPQYLRHILLV
jgi:hypothetical protein